jgi:hypothetical protein
MNEDVFANRRDFVKTSAVVVAGLSLAIGLDIARAAYAARTDDLKAAILRCGGRGTGAAIEGCVARTSSEEDLPVLRFAKELAAGQTLHATVRNDGSDAYRFKVAADGAINVQSGSDRGVLYAVYDVLAGKKQGDCQPAFSIRGIFPCGAEQRCTPEMMRRMFDRVGRWRMNTLGSVGQLYNTQYGPAPELKEYYRLVEQFKNRMDWPNGRDLMKYVLAHPHREQFDWLWLGYFTMQYAHLQHPIPGLFDKLTPEQQEFITKRKLWDYMEEHQNARERVGRLIEEIAARYDELIPNTTTYSTKTEK